MMRLGILGSTRGTNLLPIIHAIENHQLAAQIELVLTNKSDALILQKAIDYQLPGIYLDGQGLSRTEYDKKISELLEKNKVDLIVLIGYMRILSAEFVAQWENRVINIHPSLLPDFAGLMDLQVHQAVLDSGKKETGCTVHYVTKEVDAGPIVLQKKCQVLLGDTPASLKARVQQLEGETLVAALQLLSHP